MSESLDQALWLAKRQAAPRRHRRHWTPEKVARLEAMVGRLTLPEMARALGVKAAAVGVRLNQLGYSIPRDVYEPLGVNLHQAARRLAVPYEWLWKKARAGVIAAAKKDRKDYLLRWPEYRRIERMLARHQARRARVLAQIHEPTITKKEFDQMIGLSEVQTARYLQGKIVRAWRVPMPWTETTSPARWEWRVSRRDAERVTRLRAQGKLKLDTRAFRKLSRYESAKVGALRKARRLGLHPELAHRMSCVIPGCLSVASVAVQAGVSETNVYQHIRTGRLKAESRQVGNRTYRAVRPEALPPYLAWVKQDLRQKCGPIQGRKSESARVLAAGYLTVAEACQRYPDLSQTQLRSAIQRGRVPVQRIGRMLALKQKDVRAFVKVKRRWKQERARRGLP